MIFPYGLVDPLLSTEKTFENIRVESRLPQDRLRAPKHLSQVLGINEQIAGLLRQREGKVQGELRGEGMPRREISVSSCAL